MTNYEERGMDELYHLLMEMKRKMDPKACELCGSRKHNEGLCTNLLQVFLANCYEADNDPFYIRNTRESPTSPRDTKDYAVVVKSQEPRDLLQESRRTVPITEPRWHDCTKGKEPCDLSPNTQKTPANSGLSSTYSALAPVKEILTLKRFPALPFPRKKVKTSMSLK